MSKSLLSLEICQRAVDKFSFEQIEAIATHVYFNKFEYSLKISKSYDCRLIETSFKATCIVRRIDIDNAIPAPDVHKLLILIYFSIYRSQIEPIIDSVLSKNSCKLLNSAMTVEVIESFFNLKT